MRSDEPAEQKSINNLESMIVKSSGVRVAGRILAVETLITWNQANSKSGIYSSSALLSFFFIVDK